MDVLDVPAYLFQHLADVRGADERGRGGGENLATPPLELGAAAHRVLELGAVRFHDVAGARRSADGSAEEHVVAEDEVGGKAFSHRRRVRLDPGVEPVVRAVLEQSHLVARIPVEHEHGEQPADVGPHGVGPAEIVALGMRLLREDRHVVTRAAPFPSQLPRVHVRARAPEQVPVPQQDPHASHLRGCDRLSPRKVLRTFRGPPRTWPAESDRRPAASGSWRRRGGARKGGEAEGRRAVHEVRPRPEADTSCRQRRQRGPEAGSARREGARPGASGSWRRRGGACKGAKGEPRRTVRLVRPSGESAGSRSGRRQPVAEAGYAGRERSAPCGVRPGGSRGRRGARRPGSTCAPGRPQACR